MNSSPQEENSFESFPEIPKPKPKPPDGRLTTITLTANELSEFTHGVPFDCPIQSVLRNTNGRYVDVPLPVTLSVGLGVKIAEADKNETWWKVFIFPSHAEVWPSIQWRDSETKRLRGKMEQENMQHLSYADSTAYRRLIEAYRSAHINVDPRLVEILIKQNNREIWVGLGFEKLYDEWQAAVKSLPHKNYGT